VFEFRSPAAIARELSLSHNIDVHEVTVARDLEALGYVARKRKKTPYLKAEQKAVRVAFCKQMLKLSDEELEGIVFSDEKWFDSNDHGPEWQWVKKGENPEPRGRDGQPERVHIWGCIGKGVARLIFLPPRLKTTTDEGQQRNGTGVTAEKYQTLVLDKVVGALQTMEGKMTVAAAGSDRVASAKATAWLKQHAKDVKAKKAKKEVPRLFQQDGAKPHTAASTMAYLAEKQVRVITNWPPFSPDLNVIEHAWSELATKVSDHGPWGEEQIKKFVRVEWTKFAKSKSVMKLVYSFKARLQRCIELGGNVIK
jgi:hypothetical protein